MFEEFKLNTITKDEFLSGIEDKADKEEIANIVSFYKNPLCIFTQKPPIWANNIFQIQREEFDEGVTCLNESLNSLAEKLKKHMQIEKRINSLGLYDSSLITHPFDSAL